jgi:hypothetical protein
MMSNLPRLGNLRLIEFDYVYFEVARTNRGEWMVGSDLYLGLIVAYSTQPCTCLRCATRSAQ